MEKLAENWTGVDLNIYINRIREDEREHVLEQLLNKRRLRQYLDTPDGKLILNDAVNIIRGELSEIYELIVKAKNPRANIDKIVEASDRYRAVLDIMYRWTDMILKGEHHEKQLKVIAAKNK